MYFTNHSLHPLFDWLCLNKAGRLRFKFGKSPADIGFLYQHYSAKDSYLLRENYPFNEQYKVTYLASENQTNMPNQFSYLWPYSGTFSAVNSLLEATHDKNTSNY